MSGPFVIEAATTEDRDAILAVMRPWNMHHVPSPEMEELDIDAFFVARLDGRIVGAAGYKVLSQTRAKTTLLAVIPEHAGLGIGGALQRKRLDAMHRIGVKKVVTNADRPATIHWYRERFGYEVVGTLKKVSEFGDPQVDHWTTLELDLEGYMQRVDRDVAARRYLERNEPHPLAPYPPLLVNVCLTGMVPTKDQTAHVPVTPDEIIEDAVRVYDAGARAVHIHARDHDGKPTWKATIYERIIAGIRRERRELLCCVSTSGRNWSDLERRAEVLSLTGAAKPDFASLTLGSMNFLSGPSVNAPETIFRLAQTMQANRIRPELEVFDTGMIGMAKLLERKGLLGGRKSFNLLLGNLGTMPATIGNLAMLVAALPDDSVWAAAGIGIFQLPMNLAAIAAGGGVRVGIEDSMHYDHAKTRLATNEELVRRVVRIAAELERPVATPAEARQLLGVAE